MESHQNEHHQNMKRENSINNFQKKIIRLNVNMVIFHRNDHIARNITKHCHTIKNFVGKPIDPVPSYLVYVMGSHLYIIAGGAVINTKTGKFESFVGLRGLENLINSIEADGKDTVILSLTSRDFVEISSLVARRLFWYKSKVTRDNLPYTVYTNLNRSLLSEYLRPVIEQSGNLDSTHIQQLNLF